MKKIRRVLWSFAAASLLVSAPAFAGAAAERGPAVKYVFLFIGDGMSYPQIQSTADYLGALKDGDYFTVSPV